MNSSLFTAWIAEMGIVTYRGIKSAGTKPTPLSGFPLPSEYASTFVIYGILSFIPGRGAPVASLFGWGLVAATLLNLWNPGGTVKSAGSVAATGQGTGKGATTSAFAPTPSSNPTNPIFTT
jgi:hypothetical protein